MRFRATPKAMRSGPGTIAQAVDTVSVQTPTEDFVAGAPPVQSDTAATDVSHSPLCVLDKQDSSKDARIAQLEEQLAEMQDQAKLAESRQAQQTDADAAMQAMQEQISKLKAQLQEKENHAVDAARDFRALETQKSELASKVTELEAKLAEHVEQPPETEQPTTIEGNEEEAYSQFSKLFRFNGSEWKESGKGEAKLLKHPKTGKARFMLRQETTKKVIANHMVVDSPPYCHLLPQDAGGGTCWVWTAQDFADDTMKVEKLALKFGTPEKAESFRVAFEKSKCDNKVQPAQLVESEAEKTARNVELQTMQEQISQLRGQLQEKEEHAANSLRDLTELTAEKSALAAKVVELEAKPVELEAKAEQTARNVELQTMQEQNSQLRAQLQEKEEHAANSLRDLTELKAEKSALAAKVVELEAKPVELEAKVQPAQLVESEAEQTARNVEMQTMQEQNSQLRAQLQEKDEHAANSLRDLTELKAEKSALGAKVEELEAKSADLEAKLEKYMKVAEEPCATADGTRMTTKQAAECADSQTSLDAQRSELQLAKAARSFAPEVVHIGDDSELQELEESYQTITTVKSAIASPNSSFHSNQDLDDMFAFGDGAANMRSTADIDRIAKLENELVNLGLRLENSERNREVTRSEVEVTKRQLEETSRENDQLRSDVADAKASESRMATEVQKQLVDVAKREKASREKNSRRSAWPF